MPERKGSHSRTLHVALFGAGKMATHHARAIRLLGNASLVAVADPAMNGKELPKEFGEGTAAYSSPEDLLSCVKPNVVHVCTPPETHASLAKLALRHGANVYVEKPFTLTVAEAVEVTDYAKETGLSVCAGHQLLFEAPARQADELSKKLGRIVYVESYFSFKPVRRSRDGRAAISPLEQLSDILPHPVYLLLHFLRRESARPHAPVEIRSLSVNSSGSIHGILNRDGVTGILSVTLEGRPVESYLRIVGTNGCLNADFVRGTVVALPGPGVSTISKVLSPYQQSCQMITKTTRSLFQRLTGRQKSYPGLLEIITDFYCGLETRLRLPVSHFSILETVAVCEEAVKKLKDAEREENAAALRELERMESELAPVNRSAVGVLITGGTGMLGKAVARELRKKNRLTRVVARTIPPASKRIPGVEYAAVDLAATISPSHLRDISIVVHCAAETIGGKEAHERNSIGATRNLLKAMQTAGVKNLVHISSIAVLKTGREVRGPVDENTPLAIGDDGRGPYVWGKVESERIVSEASEKHEIELRVIRPGPLVSYEDYEPPGRLGREVGGLFVMIGSKMGRLDLCSVDTAARVILEYVDNFRSMPPVLNLIEPNPPTRGELVDRLLASRPDLKVLILPSMIIRGLSPVLTLLQRLARPRKKPIDIYSAFASENYDSRLAAKTIQNMTGRLKPT